MNNQQFRKLVLDQHPSPSSEGDGDSTAAPPSAGTKTLGHGNPRRSQAVAGRDSASEFARAARTRYARLQPGGPGGASASARFKSSAPKGSRFGAGYVDRAMARLEATLDADAADDQARRIAALEEQVALGRLDPAAFEALRDEIAGGDVASTHLVKGLDRKLLARVRRGEDVLGLKAAGDAPAPEPDVDEQLERWEEQAVEAAGPREKKKNRDAGAKSGELARAAAGVKRRRDEILAEMKAQRQSAVATGPLGLELDGRWSKVGEKVKPRIEIDRKGREVLITVDDDGNVKKKVRKVLPAAGLEMPDVHQPVLGADAVVPEAKPILEPADDDDDDDIFAGAGTEYNPLGDDEDDDSDSSAEDESKPARTGGSGSNITSGKPKPDDALALEEPPPGSKDAPRTYFKDTLSTTEDTAQDRFKGIENVLQKAAKIGSGMTGEDDTDSKGDQDSLTRRAKMLSSRDRDFDDLDLGFGESRGDDREDAEESQNVRLSQWKNGDDGWEENGKTEKKKRKPKKRKGDANNVADIMRVIEDRKTKGS